MKVIGLKETSLDACVKDAQHERIVITDNGKPVALVVGVAGLDTEQLELGSSPKFWELISRRREQKTFTRTQLEKKIAETGTRRAGAAQHGVAAANPRVSANRKRKS